MSAIFYAYRKAKADCFFDRNISVAEKFVQYESNLFFNLSQLLNELQAGHIESVLARNVGSVRVVAKKLAVRQREGGEQSLGHTFFSDHARAFARLCSTSQVVPEFRLIGDFSVEAHLLSALWINFIGHKFDGALSNSAYGARVRRCKPEPDRPVEELGAYHIEAVGTFEQYFGPYRRWRQNGMSAIRDELKSDRSVVAMSLDLTSYYHQIDVDFLANKDFIDAAGVDLSSWESSFNSAFVVFLKRWSDLALEEMRAMGVPVLDRGGGIPIGLAAVRIISNVLLVELDKDIVRGVAPIYYGRYVDDIFLVLKDPGELLNSADVLEFISKRTSCFPGRAQDGLVNLTLPGGYQGRTVLLLQQSKQKAFFLKGSGGLDLLDNIETQIRSVSSERRLMPSPDRLSSMASAKVLSAAGHPSEEADTLRRADGLSVRRLSWSLQLRAVEILARDLREGDWAKERKEFYRFAHSHILRPDKILDHIDYLPRLLSLAVAMADWAEARRLFDSTLYALNVLRGAANNGFMVNGLYCDGVGEGAWGGLLSTIISMSRDAAVRSLRWDSQSGQARAIPEVGIRFCKLLGLGDSQVEIEGRALAIREADWARVPYKSHLRRHASRQRQMSFGEAFLYGAYTHFSDLNEFISRSQGVVEASGASRVNGRCSSAGEGTSFIPYLFPTRPYSTQEISLFLPDSCIFGSADQATALWARFTRAVRGVWVWGGAPGTSLAPTAAPLPLPIQALPAMPFPTTPPRLIANLGGCKKDGAVRLGISSLSTEDVSWSGAAAGRPDLSRERYARLESIVNQAISANPRPTYLLLPELALPERWIDTVSTMLRSSGINLVAGLDYQHSQGGGIHSSAVLVLSDTRLGFNASVEIRQVKSLAAPGEEKSLEHSFGKFWTKNLSMDKAVYIHEGFCFGVLVCSELQNVNHRLRFQGQVDCLMVLSWNQDLDTFSALVESASLDVHANIALVNNRRYGDSRVRVPSKQAYDRDLCRLRGGKNEHVVVVEVEYESLREFQSRARRWPDKDDPFKPVPEGFDQASYRKVIPK